MNFDLGDELTALQAEARQFAADVVAPGAVERDRSHEFPRDLVDQAAERGWTGLLVSTEHGGVGLGNLAQCVVLEEIAVACASTHVTLSVHNSLACGLIAKSGSNELKGLVLPSLASGKQLGCYLLTEPGAGSDAISLKSTAVADGDSYILNGEKIWITTADEAGFGVVFAKTDLAPDARPSRSISAFCVDMNADGVTCGKREEKLGIRSSSTTAVSFENVRIPATHLIGEVGQGFGLAMDTLNGGRIGISIQAIGIARAAMEALLNVPSHGKTQPGAFRIASMATRIDAARLLSHRAAVLRDKGLPHVQEASMAKLFASQMANDICREAAAALGEVGCSDDFILERLMRDVRVTELYE
ncbi:MAG: acyl-CoA dehydrogenase family protein, partial [Pirellulaceae bacterium]|nr:acyl-CoA dehydrogenase family protein [Pirellulaceae bacterium]